jgi:integrase
MVDGKYYYDRDPEALFKKIQTLSAPPVVTFREIAYAWETEHRQEVTDRTWANYKPHFDDIVSQHGDRPMQEVTALDVIQDLQWTKSQGYSATIASTRRSLYSMIFDYAVQHRAIYYNPAIGVKLPKGLVRGKRDAPDDIIMDTVLCNIGQPFGFFPFLLLCTGLRKSEALALQWSDIDFSAKVIRVTKSIDYFVGSKPKYKTPKTEMSRREVPIIDILYSELKKRHDTRCSDYLFPAADSNRSGKGGGLMTERGYEGEWRRYCEALGLIDADGKTVITAHHMRHGTATLLFEYGVDVLTAQRILGHSKPETTQAIYTALREKQAKKSISKMNVGMSRRMSKVSKEA